MPKDLVLPPSFASSDVDIAHLYDFVHEVQHIVIKSPQVSVCVSVIW